MDPCHDNSFTHIRGINTACEVQMYKGMMLNESLSVPQSRAAICPDLCSCSGDDDDEIENPKAVM